MKYIFIAFLIVVNKLPRKWNLTIDFGQTQTLRILAVFLLALQIVYQVTRLFH